MLRVASILEPEWSSPGLAVQALHRALGEAGLEQLRADFASRQRIAVHELQKALESHGTCKPTPPLEPASAASGAVESATAAAGAAAASTGAAVSGGSPDHPTVPEAAAPSSPSLEAMLKELRREVGESNSSHRSLAWLQALQRPAPGHTAPLMVDSFAALWPRHTSRATAWSQHTNGRPPLPLLPLLPPVPPLPALPSLPPCPL